MKKNYFMGMKALLLGLFTMNAMMLMADGSVSNSNMSVAYLRNPAREGAIDIDGVYYNPAGTAFLSNGLHFGISLQTAVTQRDNKSIFEWKKEDAEAAYKEFKDKGYPILPAVHFTYNWDRWNVQAGFNITGGDGKNKYDDTYVSALNLKSLTTESYQYGIFVGTSFEVIKEWLSISAGLQGVYASNKYNGSLTDDSSFKGRQTGFGVTPVLGADFRFGDRLNLSVRYQFQNVVKMSTNFDDIDADDTLNELKAIVNYDKDNKKIRSDVPGFLSVGAQVSIIKSLRLNAAYRYYDEKHAKNDIIEGVGKNKGTHEPAFGLEWDIFKYVTASVGYQGSIYGSTEKELLSSWENFKSVKLNNHSLMLGVRLNFGSHVSIDLGYMHTFYKSKDLTVEETADGTGTVTLKRQSDLFGAGVNLTF